MKGGTGAEHLARFAADVAPFAERQDWIVRKGGVWVISSPGKQALKRQLAEGDDAFRAQHQVRRQSVLRESGETVTVDDSESPLAWLRRRKDRTGKPLLSAAQFRAGERLRADYTLARLTPRVTANWDASAPAGRSRRAGAPLAHELSDTVLAAKERVRSALRAVGPDLEGVLISVCCELMGLEEVERRYGWPQRSAKVVLGIALNSLARHYGYLDDAERAEDDAILHWGSEDYRPTLSRWQETG